MRIDVKEALLFTDSFGPLQLYRENRLKVLSAEKESGRNPYPHKFQVELQVPQYVEKYSPLPDGTQDQERLVAVAGTQRLPSWGRFK